MTEFAGEIGRLNGVHAEIGTILGPDLLGQWFTVTADDDAGCTVRYATSHDMLAARMRNDPQSMAELRGLPRDDV